MTISYDGNFAALLFRWKGSIWKSIWFELMIFITTYYMIRLIYQFALNDDQQHTFNHVAVVFNGYTKQLPLTFLLGFYVALIVKRWWEQFEKVAWPDDLLSYTCAVFHKNDEESRKQRHTIARYSNLAAALAWREISVKVRCRFPLIESFVQAGLMTDDELVLYLSSPSTQTDGSIGSVRWQLPLTWIQRMVEEHMRTNEVSPPLYSAYLTSLMSYRSNFQELFKYDWVCVPLVYTQVAALATYGYFAFCLLGRQFLNPEHQVELYEVDMYIPIFTLLQFVFFVGWFKVGQDLMRPFGEDDDDIELNYILDRNVAVSFALVHHGPADRPIACAGAYKDKLYEAVMRGEQVVLPHTRMSSKIREHPPKMHAFVDTSNPKDMELTTALVIPQADKASRSFVQATTQLLIGLFVASTNGEEFRPQAVGVKRLIESDKKSDGSEARTPLLHKSTHDIDAIISSGSDSRANSLSRPPTFSRTLSTKSHAGRQPPTVTSESTKPLHRTMSTAIKTRPPTSPIAATGRVVVASSLTSMDSSHGSRGSRGSVLSTKR